MTLRDPTTGQFMSKARTAYIEILTSAPPPNVVPWITGNVTFAKELAMTDHLDDLRGAMRVEGGVLTPYALQRLGELAEASNRAERERLLDAAVRTAAKKAAIWYGYEPDFGRWLILEWSKPNHIGSFRIDEIRAEFARLAADANRA
jgi:hypothetical protein